MSHFADGLATRAAAAVDAPTLIAADTMPAAWRRAMASSEGCRASKPASSSSSSSGPCKVPSHEPSRHSVHRSALSQRASRISRISRMTAPVQRAQLPPLHGGQSTVRAPLVTRARHVASNIMASKLLTATFVFFFTMMALLSINPPMARDADDPRRRSWYKVTIWSLLAFCAALCLPWCFPTARVNIE